MRMNTGLIFKKRKSFTLIKKIKHLKLLHLKCTSHYQIQIALISFGIIHIPNIESKQHMITAGGYMKYPITIPIRTRTMVP